ncbi:hypothetical protein MAR_017423 [Mya arenaria]|uniref:Uncharacterized protein n=1 Tax=Mya arenaria TaxID=6604 RepID=A0ABY7EEI1_MYAAR|nr:uncharacterized protein LOC128238931 [Mya arenaria]WAR07465.1 hypothetical protein MAR_017423 [Mya arenaria]
MQGRIFRVLTVCLFLFLLCLGLCEGLMCYFCEDSSEKEGKDQCKTWIRTMMYYRKKYNEQGAFTTKKYVKNCTGFANLPEEQVFCSIMYVKSGGILRSYIRGCSDGRTFFDEEFNLRVAGTVKGDNQTKCIGQGESICITLCNGQGQDFCNGPLLSKATGVFPWTNGIMSLCLLMLFIQTLALDRLS